MSDIDVGYWKKDPEAELDFSFDWAGTPPQGPWLEPGDTIVTSTWTASPPGLTIVLDPPHQPARTDTTTTVWLAGGSDCEDYWVTNRIVTAAGREDERSRRVVVRSR